MPNANEKTQYHNSYQITVDGALLRLIKLEIEMHAEFVLSMDTDLKTAIKIADHRQVIGARICRMIEQAPF